MTPSLNDDDHDSEITVHEERMNEMLTIFFGDGNNDDNNDHMVDSNNDSRDNCHQRNVDDNNMKDSKKAARTPVFKLGASRTSTSMHINMIRNQVTIWLVIEMIHYPIEVS